MKRILFVMAILFCATAAKANDVYIAQSSAGSNNGTSCANAFAVTFFNSSGNWPGTITSGTTVHLCGVITTTLTFQGSGASGNPVTVLFETGASIQQTALSSSGGINLNGKSHLRINGGPTCGETSFGSDTACNGLIESTLSGSSGQTCPGGPCVPLSDTASSAIQDTGNTLTDIEIENLTIGPIYKQGPVVNDGGSSTTGVGFIHDLPTSVNIHNNNFRSVMKAILVAWSDNLSTTQSGFHYQNNNFQDQCWALGMGLNTNSSSFLAADVQFSFNEVSNWGNWPYIDGTSDDCHANGTQIFSFNSGQMGDSTSSMQSNYVHGDLTAGQQDSSPSGLLSCQDNCGPVNFFNNVVVSTCVNPCGGGNLYMNGPNGGGQKIYNNTLICNTSVSPIVIEGSPPALIKNNVISGCGVVIEIRPNCSTTCATSDYNDGSGNSNPWLVSNSANSGNFISLASWQGSGEDTHSTTGNPNLTGVWNLGTGSAAKGVGVNLTGVVTGINVDALGNARPSSGAWDMGAVQSGGSTSPAVSLSPSSLTFTGIGLGQSGSQPITLTNTGSATLTISSVSITGSATFTQTNTCGGSVTAGNNCVITVKFTPVAVGTVSGAVSISDNATGSPHTASLSGTGTNVAPATPVLVGSLPAGTVGQSYSGGLTASGGSPPYTWTVSPTLPAGLSMNLASGLITGVPTTASSMPLQFVVTDTTGAKSSPYSTTLTINSASSGTKETINSIANQSFSGTVGGTIAAKTFSVADSSPINATMSVSSDVPWMTVSEKYPDTRYGQLVTMTISTSGLVAGTYTGHATVTVPNQSGYTWTNSPLAVPVTLTLTGTNPPPTESMTTTCAWLKDNVTWQCSTVTSNIPSGQTIKSVVTSGTLTNTVSGTHP